MQLQGPSTPTWEAQSTRLAWPSEAHGLALVALLEARLAMPLIQND